MEIDLNRYLGKWFEIAKIPNLFQLNMEKVTAEYHLNDDGTIKIVNTGYVNGILKQSIGTAKTTSKDDLLKVSFLSNIYSDYKILAIDEDYQYSLVGGSTPDFLWILSRTPKISREIYDKFINIAKNNGYNVGRLKITK